jgi:hypothetical protein
VPKVQHKPIKSPRKGSNRKEQNQPKAAMVWCTRVDQLQLASFRNLGSHSAIIHQTVRCSTGLSGVPSGATANSANGRHKSEQCVNSARTTRVESEQAQKAHQTVNSDCPVHHRTVRWPHLSELQRSNPNGWVMWLAHRTVSSAPIDNILLQRPFLWLGL